MPAKHPNKHVRTVIAYAESLGWAFQKSGRSGNAFGAISCPRQDRTGCRVIIYSTPRNVEAHARRIRREIDACPHLHEDRR